MTLEQLTTPFERRRVIEYGKDGNKVVRHWYEVQHVTGNVYKSRDIKDDLDELEFSLFNGFTDKLMAQSEIDLGGKVTAG